MRQINKSDEPQALIDWKAATLDFGWSAFQNPVKSEVLSQLVSDQGGICCYCNGSLSDPKVHIEHFEPQSKNEARRFDWSNLFASCGGEGVPPHTKREDRHCGHAKEGDYPRGGLIDLTSRDCEAAFNFALDGSVAVSDPSNLKAADTLRLTNLTSLSLVRRRAAAITAAYGDIEQLDENAWQKVYIEADVDGNFVEFQGVLKHLFEKEVRGFFSLEA